MFALGAHLDARAHLQRRPGDAILPRIICKYAAHWSLLQVQCATLRMKTCFHPNPLHSRTACLPFSCIHPTRVGRMLDTRQKGYSCCWWIVHVRFRSWCISLGKVLCISPISTLTCICQYDETVIQNYDFDFVSWLNVANNNDGTLDTIVGVETGIDSSGTIMRNAAFADNGIQLTAQAMNNMLQSAPSRSDSNWYSRFTFLRCRGTVEVSSCAIQEEQEITALRFGNRSIKCWIACSWQADRTTTPQY